MLPVKDNILRLRSPLSLHKNRWDRPLSYTGRKKRWRKTQNPETYCVKKELHVEWRDDNKPDIVGVSINIGI